MAEGVFFKEQEAFTKCSQQVTLPDIKSLRLKVKFILNLCIWKWNYYHYFNFLFSGRATLILLGGTRGGRLPPMVLQIK